MSYRNVGGHAVLLRRPPDAIRFDARSRKAAAMLYQLYETQRALMAPFAEFASAAAKLSQVVERGAGVNAPGCGCAPA